jgi:hypothetical protein
LPSCYYIWFRKTTGGFEAQGSIIGNHFNGSMEFDEDEFSPEDTTNYGALEVTQAQHETMENNVVSGGTYGKHVADPETTPSLADGDPS